MSNFAIQVSSLSKKYTIGARRRRWKTLGETLSGLWKKKERSEEMWALRDVSFDVRHGEAIGVVGHNGAGKSTLLKILSKVTYPTQGSVSLEGRLSSLLEVGTGFHPELTGRENVFLNGSILGMSRQEIQRNFDAIVAFAEVERFLDTPVKHYSSGMHVRLAFSVAAHLQPEILIVDEVLAVGDVRFQRKCLGKMGEVAGSGRTVLFVSHNLPAVRSFCSRGIWIGAGSIQQDGPIHEVVDAYLKGFKGQSAQCTWDAHERPGNETLRLNAFRLHHLDGSLTDSIPISQGGYLSIQFEILHEGTAGFLLQLFTEDGICCFSSLSNQESHYYGKSMGVGFYRTTCHIPGDFLAAGSYMISLSGFGANYSDRFTVDRAIHFEANDDGYLRGDYFGVLPGVMRPRLHWDTFMIQNNWAFEEIRS